MRGEQMDSLSSLSCIVSLSLFPSLSSISLSFSAFPSCSSSLMSSFHSLVFTTLFFLFHPLLSCSRWQHGAAAATATEQKPECEQEDGERRRGLWKEEEEEEKGGGGGQAYGEPG